MLDFSEISAVIIESIMSIAPDAPGRKATIGVRSGSDVTGIVDTARSEGRIEGRLAERYPGLPIHFVPRGLILCAFRDESDPLDKNLYAGAKGTKLDHEIIKKLSRLHLLTYTARQTGYPGAPGSYVRYYIDPGNYYGNLLSTVDKRDAYLAALYPALPLTLGIDPAMSLQTSTWVLQRDGLPLQSGTCDTLLHLPSQ